jgi:acyl transferase domain-containing protein
VCVVLKPLSEALKNGDPIRAVIRNTGVNQDGRTPGITMPSGESQRALIRSVYSSIGLDPADTQYVEAHGTGTAVGDPIEAKALAAEFCQSRLASEPLLIGSVKTNIGHLEGASGLAGLIKTVLMLENNSILPNINFKNPNPSIPMEILKVKVLCQCHQKQLKVPRH